MNKMTNIIIVSLSDKINRINNPTKMLLDLRSDPRTLCLA